MQRSFGQLFATLKDLRSYPMTLTFLLAYLFYNDGIQTVIYAASTYGAKQLKFGDIGPDRDDPADPVRRVRRRPLFGRLAAKYGAYRSILWGLFAWMVIVVVALFLPEKNVALFLAVGVAIGIVLGGTQALSRSFFSLLIPRGREGEYFALYNACERGTSWFGVAALRRGPPAHRLLPAGDRRADHLLRARRVFLLAASTRSAASARPATRSRRSVDAVPDGSRAIAWSRQSCQATLGRPDSRREEYGNLRGLGTVNSSDGIVSTVSAANL